MLKKKRQQKYLIERWLKMRRQLYAFADSGSEEALHKLRVEIKKTRAFEKFTALYKGKKKAVHLKTIKKIFHHAGIIREAGINLQMMKQYHISYPAFGAEATHILQQESGKFRLHTARYDQYIKNTVKSLLKILRPVGNSDIRRWFNRQLKKIATGVAASSTDQLHLARKNIKYLLYVHGILQKRLADKLNIDIAYLDGLQDRIGKWHDMAVAVELLASGNAENKAISRLQKEQDKTGAAVQAISSGFWDKAHRPPQ